WLIQLNSRKQSLGSRKRDAAGTYGQRMLSNNAQYYLRGIVLSGFSLAVVNESIVVEGSSTSR
ncbi:hypothetical protein LSAT2_013579, partial [Lamellibrachia satsuma]